MLAQSAATLDTVRSAFPSQYFERGLRYQRQGRATITSQPDGGDRLEGVVRGSRRAPYRVDVTLIASRNGHDVIGHCSCPIGFNCKHVAALMIESLVARQRRREVPAKIDPLTPVLRSWLDALDWAAATGTDEYPAGIRQRLLYVLSIKTDAQGARQLRVGPRSLRLLNDGTFSNRVSNYQVGNIFSPNPAKYLRPMDHVILRELALSGPYSGADDHPIDGEAGSASLERMIGTGRCHWLA
ncbi:MAG: hypothetical protein HKM95_09080, partial [Inquilinus sp.]|nr:hypothetical protein [Inquilinus sp.]